MLNRLRSKKSSKTTTKKQPAKKGKNQFYSVEEIQALVRQRAYEIYLKRSGKPGDQTSDWLVAEKLVKNELRIA